MFLCTHSAQIGIKVWVFNGEIFNRAKAEDETVGTIVKKKTESEARS